VYYEPDASGPGVDGPGYSPDAAQNRAAGGPASAMRDFPGLYEDMNRPFAAVGLGLPWYGIFGNHDGSRAGQPAAQLAFAALATGCNKASRLSPAAMAEYERLARAG
jgi:hypothetical protein